MRRRRRGRGRRSLPPRPWSAALLTAALIYVLAWRRGVDGYRLVLVGIGVGAR